LSMGIGYFGQVFETYLADLTLSPTPTPHRLSKTLH